MLFAGERGCICRETCVKYRQVKLSVRGTGANHLPERVKKGHRMKTIRIGIIGCGRISRGQHVKRFMKVDAKSKSEIVAVYDIKPAHAKQCLAENNTTAKICKSLDELLAEPIDAVVIATPNDTHCELALKAIAAGKHVFVEKPMAGSVADAEKMIRAAEAKGVVLLVDQSFRYMALYQAVKKELDKGAIGNIIHAHCIRTGGSTPNITWSPGADWYVQKKHSGGVIFDHAVHMADVLQWLVGPIKTVQSTARTRGMQAVIHSMSLFDFANGATGVLEHAWNFPAGTTKLEFYGDKGMVLFPEVMRAEFYRYGETKPYKVLSGKPDASINTSKQTDAPITIKPVATAQETFLKAVAAKKLGMWDEGRQAVAACEAILKAAEEGKRVRVRYHREK